MLGYIQAEFFGSSFYATVFGVLASWAIAYQVYHKRYTKWSLDKQYGRPPILVTGVINVLFLVITVIFRSQTNELSFFDGVSLIIALFFVIILFVQGGLSLEDCLQEENK